MAKFFAFLSFCKGIGKIGKIKKLSSRKLYGYTS